jgi:hypothetical protein
MGLFGSPQDRFAKRVIATLRGAGVTDARYDPDEFSVEFGGAHLYLSNVFRECQGASRTERDERIARLARTFLESPKTPKTWPDARPMLRPVLRGATFGLIGPPNATRPLRRPALPYLHELVVIDTPTAMGYVTANNLAEWGVTEAQVFDAARANLAALAGGPAPGDGPTMLRFVDDGNGYFVSRLLVDGWLDGLATAVGGRPVAFAPENNTLVVVADRPDGLPALLELMEREYREAPRSISPYPYTVDHRGMVVPYTVPEGDPLHGPLSRAAAILASDEYTAQATWLAREHERDGTDVFVARLMAVQRQDGPILTIATWTRDVDTLLPETQIVALCEDEDSRFYVPWAVLEREVDLEPEPGLDPVRYRLRTWPPEGVVARLRAAAVTP